jgi:hypothetical protein
VGIVGVVAAEEHFTIQYNESFGRISNYYGWDATSYLCK